MESAENAEWLPLYSLTDIDDVGHFAGDFSPIDVAGLYTAFGGGVSEISGEVSVPFEVADCQKNSYTQKRNRDQYGGYVSKASREKVRRDKLNDRFLELGSFLEPGKKLKTDKSTILCDAIRAINQLRGETDKLKEENEQLEEKVKELKVEKNELREEKLKLKADKERLEQQIKAMSMPAEFVPHQMKLMPFVAYPGVPMWQFLPPALVDSSKDPAGVSPGA